MSALLTDPTVVLAVGGSDAAVEDLAGVVTDGRATAVRSVATVDAFEARDDVGCVVVLAADEGFPAACERVRAVSADLPVLVHVADPDEASLAALARWPDCRYLPRSTAPEAVRAAVDGALATYERRRDEAADSDILDTMLSELDVSLFAKDRQGRIVRSTPLIDGASRSDLVGKTDREVFGDRHPRVAEATYRDDLDVVETGEAIRGQRERFGETHWSETTKVPWRDEDGAVRGLVGAAVDVTDEVAYEQRLAERNRRFDQFASYVSHDLRTPLQVATGALDRARDGDEAALDKLEDAHDRIEEIIDDLRRLTEDEGPEEGSSDLLEAVETLPATRLRSLVETVWRVTAGPEATLELAVPEDTVVVADSAVVRPLLENLLKNAVEHGSAGRAGVTVRVGTTDDGPGFFVEDDGPGIPADRREAVLRQGYTTAEDGTGTGLAIVNETTVQQNWELSVGESADGGARFEVTDCPVVVPVETEPTRSLSLSDSADVGDPATSGRADYDAAADRWTVVGGGRDVWGDVNEFHFVSTDVEGPVRLQGRVAALDDVDPYSKAGFAVRNGRGEDAAYGYVGRTGEHGSETIRRRRDGERATSDPIEEPPDTYPWYRVERVGDTVTCSLSEDGAEWQPVAQFPVAFSGPVAVGLVVNSHAAGETATARFADVTVAELDVRD